MSVPAAAGRAPRVAAGAAPALRPGGPSLFWRTFLLILAIILTSFWVSLQTFRILEREPQAQQIARQVISIVNTTRSALVYSDPVRRRGLLMELADAEGIRVVPRETTDRLVPLPADPLVARVAEYVAARLGPETQFVSAVNGVSGVWVSFAIDDDAYWVYIERDPMAPRSDRQWAGLAAIASAFALLAAALLARLMNRPLSALSAAARALGSGRAPGMLPERGPSEIRMVNRSFNRMVSDLDKLERDRSVLLAGISHDLRTPLTRLRLEVEVNDLPEATRAAMQSDIEQMDAIVGQFLEYARAAPEEAYERVDVSALVADAVGRCRAGHEGDAGFTVSVEPGLAAQGDRTELMRAVDNLLVNALRYGRDPDSGSLRIEARAERAGASLAIVVADEGPGIAPQDVERVLRPFERGEAARSGAIGSGLGLAIVDRIATRHGGRFELRRNAPHGVRAVIFLPLAPNG